MPVGLTLQQWLLYRMKEVLHVDVYQATIFSNCISRVYHIAVFDCLDGSRNSSASRCITQS